MTDETVQEQITANLRKAHKGPQENRDTLTRRGFVGLLLALAFIRGISYANLMPPWAIIDEEQHVDYIQHLDEEGIPPDPRIDGISADIVASLFATHRWSTFGFLAPSSQNPQSMGLEGHSYEGYQPPLYYVVMLPIFRFVHGSVLDKLFALRWATVLLSLLTVLIAYSLAKRVTGSSNLALLAGLILVLIPERTVAVSRVNNDTLLELLSALYLWLCVRAIERGPRDRDAIGIGIALGLGCLTKLTMLPLVVALPVVFYASRNEFPHWRGMLLSLGSAGLLVIPLFAYNFLRFGDVSGFGAVAPMLNFRAPAFNLASVLDSLVQLFGSFWVVLWRGTQGAPLPIFTALLAILFVLCCVSVVGLFSSMRAARQKGRHHKYWSLSLMVVTVTVYGFSTLLGYWVGAVPVLQGRFLLPVGIAIAVLFVSGLRRAPLARLTLPTLILALVIIDVLAIFFHFLPQYYPNASGFPFAMGTAETLSAAFSTLVEVVSVNKPPEVQRILGATILSYFLCQAMVLIVAFRATLVPRRTTGAA